MSCKGKPNYVAQTMSLCRSVADHITSRANAICTVAWCECMSGVKRYVCVCVSKGFDERLHVDVNVCIVSAQKASIHMHTHMRHGQTCITRQHTRQPHEITTPATSSSATNPSPSLLHYVSESTTSLLLSLHLPRTAVQHHQYHHYHHHFFGQILKKHHQRRRRSQSVDSST